MEKLHKYWTILRADYKITKRLGAGANGEVVKAKHRSTGKVYAIKMIIAPDHEEVIRSKSYTREVDVLKHISKLDGNKFTVKLHRVIKATASEETERVTFLVMEYIPYTLATFLASHVLEEQEASLILYNLLRAIAFLHGAGIVHRDLKPQNILIEDDLAVKLCDFGMSKFESPKPTEEMKRRNSLHVVTRHFRPPEIILMEDYEGRQVDIWSAGCIAVEVIQRQACYTVEMNDKPLVLFNGSSCFPLSPVPGDKKKVEASDQLRVILGVLGSLDESDTSFIKNHREYFDKLLSAHKSTELEAINFAEEFPGSLASLGELLSGMLQFNPLKRKSADELLAFPLFNTISKEE